MYERIVTYQDGSSSGFSALGTIEETLELLLKYVTTHGGISEISIRHVNHATHSDRDLRSLAGVATYGPG